MVKQETYEEEEPMPQGTRVYFDPEDGTLYAAQNEPIRVEVPGLIEALGRLAAVLEGNAERLDRRLRAIEDSIERSGV